MKENNSFINSKPEQDVYNKLVEQYGVNDVVRSYKEERYPFNCDFYIKSKDKFIEVNYHPSHGGHPFDETNKDDLKLLKQLKDNNSAWSNMIISVWAGRDVIKRQTALQNNLNYEMIYP